MHKVGGGGINGETTFVMTMATWPDNIEVLDNIRS